MVIEKKIWPEYFAAVLSGDKNFELRLADFECKKGDTLLLREWDPGKKEYTGREVNKEVTYVGRTKDMTFWQEEDIKKYGYQIISLK